MGSNDTRLWESLETWTPHLFLVAGAFSFVAAANYGMTSMFDSITFNSWVGTSVLLARVASLLGVAGLSAYILDRNLSVGTLSRVVVMLALIVTLGLLATAVLANLGAAQPIEAILGLGTVILSLVTYTLFGIAILRTGAHSSLIGVMLLGATVALLFGMFGRAALPINVVGTIAELGLVVTHVTIGYRLLTESEAGDRAELPPETVAE